jgi:two-component system sensor histidine kinase/response regulator
MKTYTILIADDYPENMQVIVEALAKIDIPHKIIRAINGKVLCKLAEKRIPDLIITDWEMPKMDGIEAIKHLKNNPLTRDIPVIMSTGIMTSSENLKLALDSGAVDYIRKPIDEIELQSRVNSMLKLSDSYLTIKEQNVVLAKQKEEIQNYLTQIIGKNNVIESQNAELQEMNATKDKFFSIIAHDLKNPFTSILGFSELLVGNIEHYGIEKAEEYISMINTTTKTTLTLLMNLLDWARSQTGKIKFKPEMLNLNSVFEEAISTADASAKKKEIAIINELKDPIELFADKNMIKTVLRNFISNAIKFTPKKGTITLSAVSKDDNIHISIADNGVGIPPNVIDNLFKITESYTTQGTERETGTGLGLILCKEFIDKHGGEVFVESKEGKGSTFSFSIPISKND